MNLRVLSFQNLPHVLEQVRIILIIVLRERRYSRVAPFLDDDDDDDRRRWIVVALVLRYWWYRGHDDIACVGCQLDTHARIRRGDRGFGIQLHREGAIDERGGDDEERATERVSPIDRQRCVPLLSNDELPLWSRLILHL